MAINYQKARRIRGTKFTDLLSDQLADPNLSLTGAVGKTISLKTQAKFKGLKEKIDPLRIAKFLTFGSSLGPSLYGRLAGRSKEDISYFSGRNRPIRENRNTADRIGSIGNGMGGDGGDSKGINTMLLKIYDFMKKTREGDVRAKELTKNHEEELDTEAERRHQDLLKVLDKLVNSKGTTIAEKIQTAPEQDKGIFDFLKDLMDLKDVFSLMKQSGKWLLTLLGGKVVLATSIAGLLLTPFVMSSIEKEEINKDPYNKKYDNNAYALSVRNKKEGGNLTEGQAAEQLRSKSVKQFPRKAIEEFVASDFTDAELKKEVGDDRETLKQWLKDNPKPGAMYQGKVADTSSTQQAKERQLVAMPAESAAQARSDFAKTDPRLIGSTPEATATPNQSSAETNRLANAGTTPNASTQLNNTMSENLNAKLAPMITPKTSQVVNNVNQSQNSTNLVETLGTLNVRNEDDTFMRMIVNSTRVV